MERLKTAYLLWHQYHEKLPKTQKYSLGNKIDTLLIEILETTAAAGFLQKEEKIPWVKISIRKLDTLKILLLILWESGGLLDKRYVSLSIPLDEAGRMLGGWLGQLTKTP